MQNIRNIQIQKTKETNKLKEYNQIKKLNLAQRFLQSVHGL